MTLGVKQEIFGRKDDFEILRWPFVNFNDLWGHTSFYKNITSLYF